MSFASLNAVNANKGMMGTSPTAQATFPGANLPPTPGPAGMQGPGYNAYDGGGSATGSAYTHGMGLMMTGPQTGSSTQLQNSQANPDGHGVTPGVQVPSAVGPEQQLQFDPNDPRNAALAGYRQY